MLLYSTGLLWYWYIDRYDSPWHPSTKLYLQATINDWQYAEDLIKNQLLQFEFKKLFLKLNIYA